MKNWLIILLSLIFPLQYGIGQNIFRLPLEVKITGLHQNVINKPSSPNYGIYHYRDYDPNLTYSKVNTSGVGFSYLGWPDSVDSGFGLEAEFRLRFAENWRIGFQIGYDHLYVYQWDVLDDWDWPYWEKTYIEFLPGISYDEANKTMRYNYMPDGNGKLVPIDTLQFNALFEPQQRLKELRLAANLSYQWPFSRKWSVVLGSGLGASLYTRQLRMKEHWLKRYKLNPESTQKFDYVYKLELTHFAPSKKSTRLFVAPQIFLKYQLNALLDFEGGVRSIFYLSRKHSKWLEDWLRIPAADERDFPIYSKIQFSFGMVIKY